MWSSVPSIVSSTFCCSSISRMTKNCARRRQGKASACRISPQARATSHLDGLPVSLPEAPRLERGTDDVVGQYRPPDPPDRPVHPPYEDGEKEAQTVEARERREQREARITRAAQRAGEGPINRHQRLRRAERFHECDRVLDDLRIVDEERRDLPREDEDQRAHRAHQDDGHPRRN